MTRPNSLLVLLLLVSTAWVHAQTLSGRITDESTGEPLPYTSIYVQQTGSGATSNTEGYYEVRLRPGRNVIVFQYLGYQTRVETVESGRGSLDVQLRPEALDLQEVEVLSGAEDLSYSVIRRAIAKADYHRNQLDSWSADVYLKGKGVVEKVPKLYLKFVPKEDRAEVEETVGRNFTSESFSKVTYTRPNTYSEEVISKYVVGDEDFSVSGYVFSSFYSSEVAGIVSPLAPKSFGYYKFAHEGVFVDQGELINKIRVIPRSRGEDVFEGYVYIVQDDWSLHSLELRTYKLGFTIDLKQNYTEIEDHVWMPITTNISARGGLLGVKLAIGYVASVSNYDLRLNPDLGGYVEVIDETVQPEAAATTRRENRVSGYEQTLKSGGELTRKELRRLMRDYEKEEQAATEDPKVVGNYTFKNDSVKVIRDTALWARIRPIPLTTAEVAGYRTQDSLAIVAKADSIAESRGQDTPSSQARKRKRAPRWLRFDVDPEGAFNPVEGYAAGLRLTKRLSKRVTEDTTSHYERIGTLNLRTRYGFSWKRLSWEAGYRNWTRDQQRGQYYLRGGRYLRQFDPTPAINPVINSITALVGGDNYIRLYERAYGTAGYSRRFSPAFAAGLELTYEDRRAVRNTTNRSWGKDDDFAYAPNTPLNLERGLVQSVAPAALATLTVDWKPGLKYVVRNGRRRPVRNSAPNLSFGATVGLPDVGDSRSDFTRLETTLRHEFRAGRKGDIHLLARAGAFVSDRFVDFPDYRHFATSEIFLTRLDPIGSYRLLPYYRNSTGREYFEFYGHYQFRKLLFSRIFELHLMGLKEDLFVNYLHTPTSDHYTEIGYSLDNLLRVLRLEFVAAFRDGKYDDFGVRLSITTTFFGNDDD